jgi:ubiquitin-protein ligase
MAAPPITISKETFRRLVKDVKDLIVNPLHAHGIHYKHNEDNLLKGSALIIGPTETPYENGYYLFEFNFPANYPHSPPEVKFCTNDGYTRFNPNLYTQGKVCLSILNTWQGEQWTGCQTIASTLLAICSILTNKPLLNEPGINESHKDFDKYNTIITYKNFEVAMLQVLQVEVYKGPFICFTDIIKTHFTENYAKNMKRLNELLVQYPVREQMYTTIYHMNIMLDYPKLATNLFPTFFQKVEPKPTNLFPKG